MDKNVIKELRVKAEDGSFPANARFPISTDPKYISPIRGCNLNNLEEQLILGPNCIKSYWTDIDTWQTPELPKPQEYPVAHTRIEYREDIENPTNYYVLDIVNKAFTSFAFGAWFGKEEGLVRTTGDTENFIFGGLSGDIGSLNFSTVLDRIRQTATIILSESIMGCFKDARGGYIKEPEFLVYQTGVDESAWNEISLFFGLLEEMPYKTYTLSFMKNKEATPIPIIEKNEKILSFPNIHLDHYDSDTETAYVKIDGMNEEKYNELKNEQRIDNFFRKLPYFFTIKETTENKLIGG